jgi:transposase
MKAYSVDLRTRVLAALDRGMPRKEAVTTFQVSLPSIKRWVAIYKATGSVAPRATGGGPALTITPAQEQELRVQLEAFPDATLAEHAQRWNAAHDTSLSRWTLGRAIARLGWTRKKSP